MASRSAISKSKAKRWASTCFSSHTKSSDTSSVVVTLLTATNRMPSGNSIWALETSTSEGSPISKALLSSSRLNGPLKLQKRPHFMAGDAVNGPIDLQRLGIQFVQRRREDSGQTTHQEED